MPTDSRHRQFRARPYVPAFLGVVPSLFSAAILSAFKGHTPVTTTRRLTTISVSFFFRSTRVRYRENNRFFFVCFLFRKTTFCGNALFRLYPTTNTVFGERSTRPDYTWRFSRVQPGNRKKTPRPLGSPGLVRRKNVLVLKMLRAIMLFTNRSKRSRTVFNRSLLCVPSSTRCVPSSTRGHTGSSGHIGRPLRSAADPVVH